MYPRSKEAYITVPEVEFEIDAPCGCRLICDDSSGGEISLFQCSMHAAAPELQEALAQAANVAIFGELRGQWRAIVQRARGQS